MLQIEGHTEILSEAGREDHLYIKMPKLTAHSPTWLIAYEVTVYIEYLSQLLYFFLNRTLLWQIDSDYSELFMLFLHITNWDISYKIYTLSINVTFLELHIWPLTILWLQFAHIDDFPPRC